MANLGSQTVVTTITRIAHQPLRQKISFPICMWLSSRLVIFVVMLVIMPIVAQVTNQPITEQGWWDTLFAWDSGWYYKIATQGYDYGTDFSQAQYSIAFFPLYPVLIWLLMQIGIPPVVAGLAINNLAFLAALIVFYLWVEAWHGQKPACWATAVLAWCPYSLYSTVMYTEGLFFCFSISALRAFENKQYVWASIWGGLSTATRMTGIALFPAFLLTTWQQKRPIQGYLASLAIATGIFIFSLFCLFKFGDAFAFLNAQRGWRSSSGFAWKGWLSMLMKVIIGGKNEAAGYIKDFGYLLQLAGVFLSGYLLIHFRKQLGVAKVRYGFWGLWLILWLMAGDPLIKLGLIFGGLYLLCFYRQKLTLVTVIYGFFSYGIALNTGLTASVERYVYAIAPLSIASGLLLAKYPKWGFAVITFFGLLLFLFSIRFAQNSWLA